MANILAAATGNWFAGDTWVGGVVPKAGDNVYTHGKNVTINSVTVNAGSFEVGYKYKIKTAGDTDFTAVGAADSNVGTVFTATGVGSGSGDAYRVASATQVSNLAEAGATGTGTIVLAADQMELHANVVGGPVILVVASVESPATVKIVGDITGGTYGENAYYAVGGMSTGTLEIVGDITGGSGTSATAAAVYYNAAGTLEITGNLMGTGIASSTQPALRTGSSANLASITITGNITGGSVSGADTVVLVATTATVTITGNLYAGTSTGCDAVTAISTYPGFITINGNLYGADVGTGTGLLAVASIFSLTINGNVYAGKTGHGLNMASVTCTVTVNGTIVGNDFGIGSTGSSVAIAAINHTSGTALIRVRSIESGSRGNNAFTGPVFSLGDGGTYKVRLATPGGGKYDPLTLTDPGATQDWPAEADVREGVEYKSGDYEGTLIVPAADTVAKGVPVDAGVGTALLLPADVAAAVWDALLEDIVTDGSIGVRLKQAATVGSVGAQLAGLGG